MRGTNSEIKILLQFLNSSSESSLNFTFNSEIWHALVESDKKNEQ